MISGSFRNFWGNSRFPIGILIFLLASILLFPPPSKVYAAQVTLAWDASTDPAVVGYKIHYGTASGNYSALVDVGSRTTCLKPGKDDERTDCKRSVRMSHRLRIMYILERLN